MFACSRMRCMAKFYAGSVSKECVVSSGASSTTPPTIAVPKLLEPRNLPYSSECSRFLYRQLVHRGKLLQFLVV